MQFLYDKTLYFRKTASDKRIIITATAFSDEKKIVFAGLSNGFVIGWDLCIPVPVARVLVAYAHDGAITSMLYHDKTKLLITGGIDHCIKVWDPIFTDLVDVSGVERLQIEHQLINDRFYVKHLGTVMPPILPSATLSQHLKKTILVQQLDNFSRQIQNIVAYNNDLLVLCQDGSIQYYELSNNDQLKYQTFSYKSKVYFGYEDLDQTRQIEVLQQANTSGQLYGASVVRNDIQLEDTIKGVSLQSEGQESVTNVVFPVSAVVNRDDGSIFVGDSVGRLHSMTIDQNGEFHFHAIISQLHRLGMSKIVFLPRENAVVTAGNDGVSRGVVAMTCQSFFTHFNQRLSAFKNVFSIEKERYLSDEELAQHLKQQSENETKKKHISEENADIKETEEEIEKLTKTVKRNKSASNIPRIGSGIKQLNENTINREKSANNSGKKQQNKGVFKIEQLILLVDQMNNITVLESAHGGQLLDVPFGDLMPNLQIVQQELEKYNIDTTFPIIIDYRKSKNHQMYSIQKQNTTSYDEYKMMKINYKKNTSQTDDFMQHQQLMLFEDQNVSCIYQMKTNRSQLFFVRNSCINIFNILFQTGTQALQFPVRSLGLFIVNQSQKSQENSTQKQHIEIPSSNKQNDNTISIDPIGTSQNGVGNVSNDVKNGKDKKQQQKLPPQPAHRSVSPVLRQKIPLGTGELDKTLSMTDIRNRTGKLGQLPGQLSNLSKTMKEEELNTTNDIENTKNVKNNALSTPRTISPYRDFLYKTRYRKVQLKKLNAEEAKLGALTPFLPDDLDAIESFIGNNLAWNDQKLPDFTSPSKEAVNQTYQNMQVPFYVAALQSNNAVKTFDPRVYQRSYHEFSQDWGVVIRATQVDVSAQTGINKVYKRLDKAKTADEVKPPSHYIKQLQLPKVEAVLDQNDIYSRLSQAKNPKKIINLKRDQNFLFYHTNSSNSQENAGLYDRDMSYTVTEPPDSHKNSIEKMELSVQTLSQLPESTAFALLQAKNRGAAAFGHSDGSLTFQDLGSGELVRVFGAHAMPILLLSFAIGPLGFIITSYTPDGRLSVFQMPFQGVFRVQMSGHSVLNEGDHISTINVGNDGLFIAMNTGNVKFVSFPIQTHIRLIEMYAGAGDTKSAATAPALRPPPETQNDMTASQNEQNQINQTQSLEQLKISSKQQSRRQSLITKPVNAPKTEKYLPDAIIYMSLNENHMFLLTEFGKLIFLQNYDLHVQKLIEQRSQAHLVPKMKHSKCIDINFLLFGYEGGPGPITASKQNKKENLTDNESVDTPNIEQSPSKQKEKKRSKKSKESIKATESVEEVEEEEEKCKIGDQNMQITAFHIACPIQKGPKLLKLVQKSNITYQKELLTELAHQMTEETKLKNQTEREANIKRQLQNSRNLKAKADISLQAILNAGRENQFIDKEMVEDVGNAFFALVGLGKRLLIIDIAKQEIIKEESFKSEITSIITVSRGEFGEKVLDCLAQTKAPADLLGCFWVGLADGTLASGRCDEFLIREE